MRGFSPISSQEGLKCRKWRKSYGESFGAIKFMLGLFFVGSFTGSGPEMTASEYKVYFFTLLWSHKPQEVPCLKIGDNQRNYYS